MKHTQKHVIRPNNAQNNSNIKNTVFSALDPILAIRNKKNKEHIELETSVM